MPKNQRAAQKCLDHSGQDSVWVNTVKRRGRLLGRETRRDGARNQVWPSCSSVVNPDVFHSFSSGNIQLTKSGVGETLTHFK